MMTLLFFAVLMYFVPVGIHGTVTLTTTGDPLTGSTISIVCHIPTFTSASGTAGWINPSISSLAFHSCIRAFCVPSVATYPRYTFSVTDTNFTITIINATLDDDDWTCEYDTPAGSDSTVLGMKVAPTSCTLTQTGSVYTCSTSCGYPQNDIYIQAKLNGTSNPENLVITTVSSPVCTSPESAFSATVPPEFYQQGGHLYCECGVTNYQSTVIQSDQVYVPGTPTTPAPSPCRCGWDWLPCDWECYYFYIIIAAVVVVVVFLLVVGVCCCCRHGYCGDDDAEAYVCCMRKKKSRKDGLNLYENENGQKNVPRSSENGRQVNPSENGRQVNPSESGEENTSESPCHNNPAYFESEGTDM